MTKSTNNKQHQISSSTQAFETAQAKPETAAVHDSHNPKIEIRRSFGMPLSLPPYSQYTYK